jgi:hypothetical protein
MCTSWKTSFVVIMVTAKWQSRGGELALFSWSLFKVTTSITPELLSRGSPAATLVGLSEGRGMCHARTGRLDGWPSDVRPCLRVSDGR